MKTKFTKQTAIAYLEMYFEFYTELRTIADEEDNIITKKDINKLTTDQLIMAAEDAQYEVRCEVGYLY